MKKVIKKGLGLTTLLTAIGGSMIATVPFALTSCGDDQSQASGATTKTVDIDVVKGEQISGPTTPFSLGHVPSASYIKKMLTLKDGHFTNNSVEQYVKGLFANLPSGFKFTITNQQFTGKGYAATIQEDSSEHPSVVLNLIGVSSLDDQTVNITYNESSQTVSPNIFGNNRPTSLDSLAAQFSGGVLPESVRNYLTEGSKLVPASNFSWDFSPAGQGASKKYTLEYSGTPGVYQLNLVVTNSNSVMNTANFVLQFNKFPGITPQDNPSLFLNGQPNYNDLVTVLGDPNAKGGDTYYAHSALTRLINNAGSTENLTFKWGTTPQFTKQGNGALDYSGIVFPLTVTDSIVNGESVDFNLSISGYKFLQAPVDPATATIGAPDSPFKDIQPSMLSGLQGILNDKKTGMNADKTLYSNWARGLFENDQLANGKVVFEASGPTWNPNAFGNAKSGWDFTITATDTPNEKELPPVVATRLVHFAGFTAMNISITADKLAAIDKSFVGKDGSIEAVDTIINALLPVTAKGDTRSVSPTLLNWLFANGVDKKVYQNVSFDSVGMKYSGSNGTITVVLSATNSETGSKQVKQTVVLTIPVDSSFGHDKKTRISAITPVSDKLVIDYKGTPTFFSDLVGRLADENGKVTDKWATSHVQGLFTDFNKANTSFKVDWNSVVLSQNQASFTINLTATDATISGETLTVPITVTGYTWPTPAVPTQTVEEKFSSSTNPWSQYSVNVDSSNFSTINVQMNAQLATNDSSFVKNYCEALYDKYSPNSMSLEALAPTKVKGEPVINVPLQLTTSIVVGGRRIASITPESKLIFKLTWELAKEYSYNFTYNSNYYHGAQFATVEEALHSFFYADKQSVPSPGFGSWLATKVINVPWASDVFEGDNSWEFDKNSIAFKYDWNQSYNIQTDHISFNMYSSNDKTNLTTVDLWTLVVGWDGYGDTPQSLWFAPPKQADSPRDYIWATKGDNKFEESDIITKQGDTVQFTQQVWTALTSYSTVSGANGFVQIMNGANHATYKINSYTRFAAPHGYGGFAPALKVDVDITDDYIHYSTHYTLAFMLRKKE